MQRRDRDEPTTFIAPPRPTAADVAPAAPGGEAEGARDPAADPDTGSTVRIEEPVAAGAGDADATRVLPPREASGTGGDPDATRYLEVSRRVVATLEAVRGELLGESYELKEGVNRLGRSPDSDVVLPSMWISRAHARVVCEGDRIEISALSDKITSVDDEPVGEGALLRDGCKIQLGGTLFRFRAAK